MSERNRNIWKSAAYIATTLLYALGVYVMTRTMNAIDANAAKLNEVSVIIADVSQREHADRRDIGELQTRVVRVESVASEAKILAVEAAATVRAHIRDKQN